MHAHLLALHRVIEVQGVLAWTSGGRTQSVASTPANKVVLHLTDYSIARAACPSSGCTHKRNTSRSLPQQHRGTSAPANLAAAPCAGRPDSTAQRERQACLHKQCNLETKLSGMFTDDSAHAGMHARSHAYPLTRYTRRGGRGGPRATPVRAHPHQARRQTRRPRCARARPRHPLAPLRHPPGL